MKKQLIAAVAIGLLAGTASAQSAFEGFYGQVATGYEYNNIASGTPNQTSPTSPTVSGQASGASNSSNAPVIAGLGYTFSLTPTYTLGVGADYSFLSVNTSTVSPTIYVTPTNYYYQVSQRTNFYVTPGYALNKDALVYLKAGYSMENIQAKAASGGGQTNTATVNGYILGLGYKQMITSGFYGFAEGNYMTYSKPSLNAPVNSNGYVTNLNAGTPSAYNFLVGVGYKF
jgi:hypothetical protein